MIPSYLQNLIKNDDLKFKNINQEAFILPIYNPKNYQR